MTAFMNTSMASLCSNTEVCHPHPTPISASLPSLYHLILALCSSHPGIPSASGMWLTGSLNRMASFPITLLTPLHPSNPSFVNSLGKPSLTYHSFSESRSISQVRRSLGMLLLSSLPLISVTITPPQFSVFNVCIRTETTSVSAHYHIPVSCTGPAKWMNDCKEFSDRQQYLIRHPKTQQFYILAEMCAHVLQKACTKMFMTTLSVTARDWTNLNIHKQ